MLVTNNNLGWVGKRKLLGIKYSHLLFFFIFFYNYHKEKKKKISKFEYKQIDQILGWKKIYVNIPQEKSGLEKEIYTILYTKKMTYMV